MQFRDLVLSFAALAMPAFAAQASAQEADPQAYPGEDAVVMGPGDYWHVPAEMAHANECVSEEPCLFFTYGDAPWDIEVVEN